MMNERERLIVIMERLLSVVYGMLAILFLVAAATVFLHLYEPIPGPIVISNEMDTLEVRGDGLVDGEGKDLVATNCTVCHSARLITQNRATREGWLNMIRWMQQTQNLWDLGEQEQAILDYLEKNYAPVKKGRREALSNIEWYEIK